MKNRQKFRGQRPSPRDAAQPQRRSEKAPRDPAPARDRRAVSAPAVRPGERLVMGRNCVREVLRLQSRRIREVWLEDRQESSSLGDLHESLQRLDVPIHRVSSETLQAMVRSDSHQGIVAALNERGYEDLDRLIERLAGREQATVLLLDSIVDPHNLGAILRVAECFGVDAVLWSKNRGVDLTPVVSKSSVGASEIVPIVRVSNLVAAAERLKEAHFWVVGSALDERAQSVWSYQVPKRLVLAIGSEESGLQQLLIKRCDDLVVVPMSGEIQSLNVAQATSVLLGEVNRQRLSIAPEVPID